MKAIKSALSSRRPSTASSLNSSGISSSGSDSVNNSTSITSASFSKKNSFFQKLLHSSTGTHTKHHPFKFTSNDSLSRQSSDEIAVPAISPEQLQSLTKELQPSTDVTPSNTEIVRADAPAPTSSGFIPLSELEGFCLDFVSASLHTLPEYVHIKLHPANELLISAISSSTYQFIKDRLPSIEATSSLLQPSSKSIIHVNSALLTDIINTRLNYLVANVLRKRQGLMAESKQQVGNVGHASEIGHRSANEDFHVAIPYFNNLFGKPISNACLSYFAIFDGHGGPECASYIGRHLHAILARHPRLIDHTQRAIKDSFIKTNKMWAKNVEKVEGFSPLAGSTGVVILVKERTLYIAWVGDSSAILYLKDGLALDFVLPHKPIFENEKKRIMKLGGSIENERVNGVLAVTRSFGDIHHRCIIPDPDIMEYTLTGNEQFLILACDGLTDVLDTSQIYEIVNKKLADDPNVHADIICRALAEEALARGSTDNVTVVFINLTAPKVFSDQEIRTDIPAIRIPGQQTPSDQTSRPSSGRKSTKHLSLQGPAPVTNDLDKGMAELKSELKKLYTQDNEKKISTSQPMLNRSDIAEENGTGESDANEFSQQESPVKQQSPAQEQDINPRRSSNTASRPRSMVEDKELEKLKKVPENGLYPIASSRMSNSLFSNNISQTRNNISELQALAELSRQMFPSRQFPRSTGER